jgi:hypothetical protein
MNKQGRVFGFRSKRAARNDILMDCQTRIDLDLIVFFFGIDFRISRGAKRLGFVLAIVRCIGPTVCWFQSVSFE